MRAATFKACGQIVSFDQAGWTQKYPDHYPALIAGCEIDKQVQAMSFDQAVVCEDAWYARTCLTALGIRHGQRTLIYRASDAFGISALQPAKFYAGDC